MLAVGTGILFSFDAAFLKDATTVWSARGMTVLVLASVLGYLGAAVLGNVLLHRADRLAPLRYSLPALTAVQPVSALVIALLVLQKHVSAGAARAGDNLRRDRLGGCRLVRGVGHRGGGCGELSQIGAFTSSRRVAVNSSPSRFVSTGRFRVSATDA